MNWMCRLNVLQSFWPKAVEASRTKFPTWQPGRNFSNGAEPKLSPQLAWVGTKSPRRPYDWTPLCRRGGFRVRRDFGLPC
jgi:hypothetical protein